MRQRLNSKEEGKTWMATSEIDHMLSVLLSDSWYEDMVFIVPASMTHSITTAFQKFRLYKEVLTLKGRKGESDSIKKSKPWKLLDHLWKSYFPVINQAGGIEHKSGNPMGIILVDWEDTHFLTQNSRKTVHNIL